MTPRPGLQQLVEKLQAYKRKYYLNQLLRGSLWTALFLLVAYLVFASLEYGLRFSSPIRAGLFFSFVALSLWMLGQYVVRPLIRLVDNHRQLSSEDAARQIGQFFPEVGDKLLNTLQLSSLSVQENALLNASIEQRSQELGVFAFTDAVPLQENLRYLRYLGIPFSLVLILWIFFPQLLKEGSGRIINYQQEFVPTAPFTFQVQNESLTAFRNEDFTLSLAMEGNALPEAVYVEANGRKLKMARAGGATFEHTFNKIQQDLKFNFEAAGYASSRYQVDVVNRPNLKNFNVRLNYPSYLGKAPEQLSNIGNLQVPQGTRITWQFNTLDADSIQLNFSEKDEQITLQEADNQVFNYQDDFLKSDEYQIKLYNEYSANREEIRYNLEVTPDEYPQISLEQFQDTTLYQYIILGGNLSDDYGLTRLRLRYRITESGARPSENYQTVSLNLNPSQLSQSYYERWAVDSFGLAEGDKLEYYVQVYDNDGVSGPKASRTATYTFALPSERAISENLDRVAEQTESQLDNTLKQAQELREQLQDTEERLRGKNNMDWRDQNQMQEMLEQRQQLEEAIKKLQEQMENNNRQQETFREPNPQLQEKMESLQELLDEVLDEETKKLWDELQKLLEEQAEKEDIQNMVENLNRNEKNMEEELDRALELFKRLQAEMKLEESLQQLEELQQKQEELAQETAGEESPENENETDDSESESGENQDGEQEDADEEAGNEQENGENNSESESESENQENQSGEENQQGEQSEQPNSEQNQQNQPENSGEPKSDEQLAEEQEQLAQEFKELQESLDEYREMNQDLKRPNQLQDTWDEEQSIQEQQEQSQQQLQQGERQKSQQSQQNATQQMEQMQSKLQKMQGSMSMQQMQEDLNNLRDIVDNLVKLSFNQEELMGEFREVQLRDPRVVELSQQQLKLSDDAQIVEDSLLALANRVFQIQSFVTRELNEMNGHMDKTVEELRDRNFNQALSEQQFTMTSMNNLALLLDDVLNQMQQQMAQAMGTGQSQQQSQPQNMGMGELQQQLNQQIQELRQSGKSGRQLSEELARMAAEQERLRKALQQMQQKMQEQPGGGQPGGDLDQIMQDMEQTELDLVNKRLTQELIERQKRIATRLLEAEKAMREQELDEEREGEQASEYDRMVPEAFEEYIRAKEKEIELLKSVPLQLNPYYKKEVSDYFKRLNDN